MALTITINLTDVEEMALRYVAADPQEWLESFVKYRSGVAIDEIYQKEVERLTAAGADSIPTNKTTVVLAAFESGNAITAAEANARMDAQMSSVTPAASAP